MRLKRLAIHKYRHVRPGTVLEFADGVNVLLGRNGTGKTTLLNLIAMIARSDFSPLKGEDFKFEFTLELRHGATLNMDLEGVAGTRWPQPPLAEEGHHQAERRSWTFRGHWDDGADELRFSASSDDALVLDLGSGPVRIGNAPDPVEPRFLRELASRLFSRAPDVRGSLLYSLPSEPSGDSAGRFDEALEAFQAITSGETPSSTSVPGPAWLQAFSRPSSLNWSMSFVPVALIGHLKRDDVEQERVRLGSATVEFLSRIRDVLSVHEIEILPIARERVLRGDEVVRTYGGFDVYVDVDGQLRVHHGSLSFGQKRLIAFFWYLACNPDGMIIADELVNGFHYDWVEACLDEIGERQAFIASQNPLLLDFMGFDSADDVRRAFVLCTLEPDPAGGSIWSWRNMGETEADEFFRSYEVGIQLVSEILRTKGLW